MQLYEIQYLFIELFICCLHRFYKSFFKKIEGKKVNNFFFGKKKKQKKKLSRFFEVTFFFFFFYRSIKLFIKVERYIIEDK